ncbi:cilia- and flagella-associated protein 141 isoform X1 [Mustela nigripes]|uniref:cilia- and flagella-associated protein 141 isoform X1 n=1 Tax=Mustela nigripes TaxID=77151 RepID=UPI0028166CCB|nr:cilia- and flagella-associated protein 141 isoform X1 [Mustela nigripes]
MIKWLLRHIPGSKLAPVTLSRSSPSWDTGLEALGLTEGFVSPLPTNPSGSYLCPSGRWRNSQARCLWQTTLSQRRNLNATARLQDTLGQELALAHRQLLTARRAALRALLEAEHRRWRRELGAGGGARGAERL